MVTNAPIHAGTACVSLSFVFGEGNNKCGKTNNKENYKKNNNQSASQVNSDTRDRRACILLNSNSILIAISEKSGVALGY